MIFTKRYILSHSKVIHRCCVSECPSDCDSADLSPVCGSDGQLYPSSCQLQQTSCRRQQLEPEQPELVVSSDPAACARTQLQDAVLCAGCPEEGSLENQEVREAADFATVALTSQFQASHYFALDSITNVKTQVSHQ